MKLDATFDAPSHLSPYAQAIWRSLVPSRARSTGRLASICVALEALDRSREASALLEAEGLTCQNLATKTLHAHPAIRIESEARKEFSRLWSAMSLHWSHMLDGGLRDESEPGAGEGIPSQIH